MIGECLECELRSELIVNGKKEDVGICKDCGHQILKDYLKDKKGVKK